MVVFCLQFTKIYSHKVILSLLLKHHIFNPKFLFETYYLLLEDVTYLPNLSLIISSICYSVKSLTIEGFNKKMNIQQELILNKDFQM